MFRIVPQLAVKSIGKSVEFYATQFGFTVTMKDPEIDPVFVTMERGDVSIFLVGQDSPDDSDNSAAIEELQRGVGVRFYFEVDNAKEVYNTLTETFDDELGELKYNEDEDYTEFTLRDPDGYEIGVYS